VSAKRKTPKTDKTPTANGKPARKGKPAAAEKPVNKWDDWTFRLWVDSFSHCYTVSEDPEAFPMGRAVLWRSPFKEGRLELGPPEEVATFESWERAANDAIVRARADDTVALYNAMAPEDRPSALWGLKQYARNKVLQYLPAKLREAVESAQRPLFAAPEEPPAENPAEQESPAKRKRSRNHDDPEAVARKARG
jgi:hypothetical protein